MSDAFKAVDAPIAGCRADGVCPTQDMCRNFESCCWPRPVEDVCHEMHSTDRAEIERLRHEVEDRQEAIDTALSWMRNSAYVGGPSERDAWRKALEVLGPFETQHVATALPTKERR